MGYLRSDGQAGVRNEIWIIPTVGCTNQTAEIIAKQANAVIAAEPWGQNVDGVYAFPIPSVARSWEMTSIPRKSYAPTASERSRSLNPGSWLRK